MAKEVTFKTIFPAVAVPMNDDYTINEPEFRSYLRWIKSFYDKGMKGLVCNGHTGEITGLTREERKIGISVLDKIREDNGESVIIHLYPATPNPINFEIGKGIMKNLDPTIVLYDKVESGTEYEEIMHLHDRVKIDE